MSVLSQLSDAGRFNKSTLSARERLKAIGKLVFENACVYRLSRHPIFIFSTRRSGSTLLMYMIHSQPGIDYVDEPLNMWRLHPHFHRLPHPQGGMFVELSSDEEANLDRYMSGLLSGEIRFRHRGNLFDRNCTFVVRGLVVKNINATPLLPWFRRRFSGEFIHLIRHPVAVALSIQRRGWPSTAHTYLNNAEFCERNLHPETVDYARNILKQGTTLQTYILEWCLDNLRVLRHARKDGVMTLSYEELVLHPDKVAGRLATRLELPDPGQMAAMINVPSRTSTDDSKRQIAAEGPQALMGNWLRQVDQDELANSQDILDKFEIDVYQAGNPLPDSSMWHSDPPGTNREAHSTGAEAK